MTSPSPSALSGRLAVVLLLLVLFIGCAASEDDPSGSARRERTVPAVEALQARHGVLPLEERLSGVVKAENQVVIRAELSAPIVEVFVRNGEAVVKGQPLVRLKDATLRDQLRQAEANARLTEAAALEALARVAELEAQVTRTRALAAEALVSQLELETQEARLAAGEASASQAQARVEQVQATVEERRSAIDRTLVRSPVAGRIGQRNAAVGMMVDGNDPLFVVGNLDELIVEIPLTESMLGYVREGQSVHITADSLGDGVLEAQLSRISPFLSAGSFSTLGEIDVLNPDQRLKPGMFVSVDVFYGESEEATLIPASALWEDPKSGVQGVYVIDMTAPASTGISDEPFAVEFRQVEVLAEGRSTVGLTGAGEGEWIVTLGQHLLSGDEATARVRPIDWGHMLELQGLQREDLLHGFLERQQEVARTRGATPPTNEEFMRAGSEKVTDEENTDEPVTAAGPNSRLSDPGLPKSDLVNGAAPSAVTPAIATH